MKTYLDKIDRKHNLILCRHYSKTIQQKPLHNKTEASALELKQPSDTNKAKIFNKLLINVTCRTDKSNRNINLKKKTSH